MGDRSTSMLFLVVLVFLAFVQSLPLSDRHYKHGQTIEAAILDDTAEQNRDNFETFKYEESSIKNNKISLEKVHQNFNGISDSEEIARYRDTKEALESVSELMEMSQEESSLYSDYEKSNLTTSGALHHRQKRENVFANSHIVPCAPSDVHYCLNAGTCVLVAALDIRTCRCIIPYTGARCEMIDVVYLFSQLAERRRDMHFGWR